MSMQMSGNELSGPEDFERQLRRSLFRFDCPGAQLLGEYQLDLLNEADRVRVAAHAASCDECRADLQILRGFLETAIEPPEPLTSRARRLVATLFTRPASTSGSLAYGGLRGAAETSTRIFEAGDLSVTMGPGQTHNSLFGLVVAGGHAPDALDGREVRLLPRDGAPVTTHVDDLGNFEFSSLAPGLYAFELDLPDGVLVIEELRVD